MCRAQHRGFTSRRARNRPDSIKTEVAGQIEMQVWPLFEQGRLKPVVGEVLRLVQAAETHRLMERAGHWGKIALQA